MDAVHPYPDGYGVDAAALDPQLQCQQNNQPPALFVLATSSMLIIHPSMELIKAPQRAARLLSTRPTDASNVATLLLVEICPLSSIPTFSFSTCMSVLIPSVYSLTCFLKCCMMLLVRGVSGPPPSSSSSPEPTMVKAQEQIRISEVEQIPYS